MDGNGMVEVLVFLAYVERGLGRFHVELGTECFQVRGS